MTSKTPKPTNVIRHEGLLPIVTKAIGIFIVAYGCLAALYGAVNLFQSIDLQESFLAIISNVLKMIFLLGLFVWAFALIGVMVGALFPNLRLSRNGIQYRFLFVKGRIRSDEIERVVRIEKPFRALAIVINRPLGIARGLWLASVYGRIVKLYEPVILIAGNLEQKPRLEQIIEIESTQTSPPNPA